MVDIDPLSEIGFILNIQNHWFTIRRIQNNWWNLNSSNEEGPTAISPFYLSVYLYELHVQGHSVFVAKGDFMIMTTAMIII